ALGRAAARVLGADRPFFVGRDTRRSGPLLEAALVAGLCSEGADVERVGVLPTPGVAYLAQMFDAPAAVLSASHNPYPDNGVKLFARGGRKIADAPEKQIETELRRLVDAGAGDGPDGPGVGVRREPLRGAADAGLAFDGDADRVIAVDERGNLVDGDQMLAIIALDLHERGELRGDAVVATVMSNLGLRHALTEHGIGVIETPVGDRNVLTAL